jgi:hypothetical protein
VNDISIRNGRWRLVGAVAIMVATVLAVALTRSTGNAQATPDAKTLGPTDAAFVQLMITMNDHALGLYVLLQNDSPLLAGAAAQLADSHRAELADLRVVLSDSRIPEDTTIYLTQDVPGLISGDDLVVVHEAPASRRDALAVELIYQHLTHGVLLATGEQASGTTPAAKALAQRTQQLRATQLALLANLPTAAPASPTAPPN